MTLNDVEASCAGMLRQAEEAQSFEEAALRAAVTAAPGSLAAAMNLVRFLDHRGERGAAERQLRALISASPTHGNTLGAAQQWTAWEGCPAPGAATVRVALTGGGTLAPLAAYLRVAIAQAELHPVIYTSEFNQWSQDLLPSGTPLYAFEPEIIVISIPAPVLFPQSSGGLALSTAELTAERRAGIAHLTELLAAARRNAPSAALVLHTFAGPDRSPFGIGDLAVENGQAAQFAAINAATMDLVRQAFPEVILLDQERLEARHGKCRVRDERLWYLASMPYSESFLPVIAAEQVRAIRCIKGRKRKAMVLDLDNTLWGGVVGEDGASHLDLGGSAAPGNAFYAFQVALLNLARRGVLLAICSKNNPEDVWEVLDHHPDMLLRREQFAALRINWQDKATNIAEIARELNLGLDAFVFVDDNPAERALVRQRLPEVLTLELPRDPAHYARALEELDVFEVLQATPEDARRQALYQEQQQRDALKERAVASGDLSSYLADLRMEVTVGRATPFTLPRIAQLIQKTNQFNLTTRRYTEAQVRAMTAAPQTWEVLWLRTADRFGDSGLTGVAIVERQGSTRRIDSFLLSCRVLGRGVEAVLLAAILRTAQGSGAKRVWGEFIPTPKNSPASTFYGDQGFRRRPSSGEAIEEWELDLEQVTEERPFPEWIKVNFNDDAS